MISAGGLIDENIRTRLLSTIPLVRFSTANDVANAALYLASDEASFISILLLAFVFIFVCLLHTHTLTEIYALTF
jgi:hypothetical protein